METLVVSHHRNHYYYGRSKSKSPRSNQIGSSPNGGFKGINCRTFQSGIGILPSPPVFTSFNSFSEPKSPRVYSEPPKPSRRSYPIAISPKPNNSRKPSFYEDVEEFSCSELWAGPAYTNSPPPSSLPIPNISLRQKRSVSLELPLSSSEIELIPTAKSAPSSPSKDFVSSATENLRRILHLDVTDD